jgi:hypothetical protein
VFKNWVLRKTFELKKGQLTGEWRISHNEELHNLYFSTNIIKKHEIGGACNTYGGEERLIQRCRNLKEGDNLEDLWCRW